MRVNYKIDTIGMYASEKTSMGLEFFFCKYDDKDYRLQVTKNDNGFVQTIKSFDNKDEMESYFFSLRFNYTI
ncbi:hypothetical protein [uncultured Cetobacterium sp.]|uniref:hypothetical protein n=1 Tax=uncultured Cetobacterium sp. TaxID=527638 RepID=UPI002601FBCC|nr:hypothetical protein [uncultured Cetobacterium sp.]